MKPFLALLAVLGCSCSVTVGTDGDCVGRLEVLGVECPQGTCSAPPDAVISAGDVQGCEFDHWTGSCGSARSCLARHAGHASFARRAWPLRVDATAAAPIVVQI